MLEENGIIILDDVENSIEKDEVNPKFVKLPDENKYYNFDNLKKVHEYVKVVEYEDEDLGTVKKVINNVTGKEVNNTKLVEVAKFADTWYNSFSNKQMAFDRKSENLYKSFINKVSEQAIKTEVTDYEKIYNEMIYSNSLNNWDNEVLKSLLSNSENLSNIRRFVEQIFPNATCELEKPNVFEAFGKSLDSEGFSKEEILKKLSSRAIGNDTSKQVIFSGLKKAENLCEVKINEKVILNR